MIKWLKAKLYGEDQKYNKVYYLPKAPSPKKGWLRKSALQGGDLWFNTAKINAPHVWADGRWKRLGTD